MKWIKNWIRGWKNTFEYYKILKENYEWDFSYLFELIEFKLERMAKYFHTHNIIVNEERYARQVDTALNILKAGYLTEIILDSDLETRVNDRNKNRFLSSGELEFLIKYPQYYKAQIRENKAKKLFWKYLEHNVEGWWD